MRRPEQFRNVTQYLSIRLPWGSYPDDFSAGSYRFLATMIMWFVQFYTFGNTMLSYYIN